MLCRLSPLVRSLSLNSQSSVQLIPTSSKVVISSQGYAARNPFYVQEYKKTGRGKANRNTQVNERYLRRERGRKVVVIELPDHDEQRKLQELSPLEYRMHMLKKGINPYLKVAPRTWSETQISMDSVPGIIDPYVPLEESFPNEGGITDGIKQKGNQIKVFTFIFIPKPFSPLYFNINFKNSGSHQARVPQYHERHEKAQEKARISELQQEGKFFFQLKNLYLFNWFHFFQEFIPVAMDIYKNAYQALMKRDTATIHKYITEHAYAKMWPDVQEGSFHWEMVKDVEAPKVVSVRVADLPMNSGNDIAQIIIRMHTEQIVAYYDRFGRLVTGSEAEPKKVLEYVVFENHVASTDGKWRLHDRINPHWLKPKEGVTNTFTLEDPSKRPENTKEMKLKMNEMVEEAEKMRKRMEEEGK
ncbi:hypothetical protein WR25_10751 [Diploscapter pachys]|uniref:Large ribosomal subunit protein mL45 n=1 Tax=Diploscapter pachys TaxID=2018661 RepID=A0A2A2JB89_9BILA|nr:hypothetical protein WR25_10751 [Diploscapter pachys]